MDGDSDELLGHGMGGQSAVLADSHAAATIDRVTQRQRAGRDQFLVGDGVRGDRRGGKVLCAEDS